MLKKMQPLKRVKPWNDLLPGFGNKFIEMFAFALGLVCMFASY